MGSLATYRALSVFLGTVMFKFAVVSASLKWPPPPSLWYRFYVALWDVGAILGKKLRYLKHGANYICMERLKKKNKTKKNILISRVSPWLCQNCSETKTSVGPEMFFKTHLGR